MDVLNQVLSVFEEIGEWIPNAIESLIPMFYTAPTTVEGVTTPGSLTFLGVLAVAGLSISVIFLLIGVIQNFLHFRG